MSMEDSRFWELVDLLGGIADDTSTPRLDAELREHDESVEFLDRVDELVAELLAACQVPPSHAGDTSEWLAAAVIAGGRSTYERTLAAGGILDPDDWAWAQAENLLVAGFFEPGADTAAGIPDNGLTLQWKSREVPVGVETSWRPDDDTDDDPAWGQVPTSDAAWEAALGVLLDDDEFRNRRAALDGLRLHVVVRDVEEMEMSAWPDAEHVDDVVLVVPVSVILAEDSRVQAYLHAVVTMMTSVADGLGPS